MLTVTAGMRRAWSTFARIGQHCHELFAAIAGNRVAGASQVAFESGGAALECLIADRVTVLVVVLLETPGCPGCDLEPSGWTALCRARRIAAWLRVTPDALDS
jgi:hypothetical protein